MITLLIFIAVLAVLVLSHEFGHFFMARRTGMGVEEFGFGFPPRLIGIRRITTDSGKKFQIIWRKKQLVETLAHHTGTLYSINLIPLGGFVRIKGENPEDPDAFDRDSFMVKKFWQKASVLVAGVVMNILVGALLLAIGYTIGMPETDTGRGVVQLEVVDVIAGNPAAAAGFKVGDKILQVDSLQNPNVASFQTYVNEHKDQELNLTVEHADGKTEVKKIKPVIYENTGKAGIGVALVAISFVKFPWYQALYEGFKSAFYFLGLIFAGLWNLIVMLFRGRGPEGGVAGPVGVAVLTGEAARLGFAYLLQFTALLSLNLAALNILPIPALDGGRLFFVVWGKVFRREVTPRFEQMVHTIGFVLLMILVIFITFNDVGTYKDILLGWWSRHVRL